MDRFLSIHYVFCVRAEITTHIVFSSRRYVPVRARMYEASDSKSETAGQRHGCIYRVTSVTRRGPIVHQVETRITRMKSTLLTVTRSVNIPQNACLKTAWIDLKRFLSRGPRPEVIYSSSKFLLPVVNPTNRVVNKVSTGVFSCSSSL